MKINLEFSLPEEIEEYESSMNGSRYKHQLEDIYQRLFRQPLKYGFQDQKLQELFESLGDNGVVFLEKLKEIYLEITNDV